MDEVRRRREEVAEASRKKKRDLEERRAMKRRGEKLPVQKERYNPYKDEEDGGIIIPIIPLGIPKYDSGKWHYLLKYLYQILGDYFIFRN